MIWMFHHLAQLPSQFTNSAIFSSAQADRSRQCNDQNHSQPNPGPRPPESPCRLEELTSLVNLERVLLFVVVDLLLVFDDLLDFADVIVGVIGGDVGQAGRGVHHSGEGHVATAVAAVGLLSRTFLSVLGLGLGLLALALLLLLLLLLILLLLGLLVLRVVGEDRFDVEPLHPIPK